MKSRVWLLAVIALLTIARIALVEALPDQGYFAKYFVFADHLPKERLADLSPGYLWFIALLRGCGLGFRAIRVLQIVMVSVAAWCVAEACREKRAAFAAALLLLGSRAALVCATDFEPETLILLLNAAALLFFMKNKRVASGVMLGLSAICRPVAILGIAILGWKRWKLIAAAALPVVIMLTVNFALTHELVLMDPGTVFYEGMNPNATGYAGVQPKIVTDLEKHSNDPDYLHVAYRRVAAHALGRRVTRAESNRYWTGKALAYARTYPGAALRLAARKVVFAMQSHDAWDLITMARKDALLARFPFVPFGLLLALAVAGAIYRREEMMPVVLFALATAATLVVFYVTARQRNALLPPLAILGGIGFAEIVTRRSIRAAILVLLAAVALSIDGDRQREDNMLNPKTPLALELYDGALNAPNPRPALDEAERRAPGNEHVLAARAVLLRDETSRQRLFALHDPLTAKAALFEAEHRNPASP